jgi:hypothetical protein
MGLRGFDGPGVIEFSPADLTLSVVDEKPHADKEDQKDDDDSFFQGSTSSEIGWIVIYHFFSEKLRRRGIFVQLISDGHADLFLQVGFLHIGPGAERLRFFHQGRL